MLRDLEIYVDEPAEYEPRGDHIVANWKGRTFHIPIAVAQQISLRLQEALAKWRVDALDNGGVVRIGRREH